MAIFPHYLFYSSTFLLIVVALQIDSYYCFSSNNTVANVSKVNLHHGHHWFPARATWYGSPTGAGSNGGSCGYSNTVERRPFSGMVASGGASIYQNGYGCGVCYKVRCVRNRACSRKPVTVTIIDECLGCVTGATHFDLSGTAYGAMAKPGRAQQLRNVGVMQVQYKKVRCNYRRATVVVRVDPGSNPTYFTCSLEYEDGFGISSVMLKEPFGRWVPLKKTWGSSWVLNNYGKALRPPYSLRLVEARSQSVLTLNNVIPRNWKAGRTYRSLFNFNN